MTEMSIIFKLSVQDTDNSSSSFQTEKHPWPVFQLQCYQRSSLGSIKVQDTGGMLSGSQQN